MFKRYFLEHPKTVNESYFEHLLFAGKFGFMMVCGGLGALVHAIVPGLCITAGSDMIRTLNRIVVEHRDAKRRSTGEMHDIEYII
jgi:ABC-type branched-subunit amino acid transport system permease subunit